VKSRWIPFFFPLSASFQSNAIDSFLVEGGRAREQAKGGSFPALGLALGLVLRELELSLKNRHRFLGLRNIILELVDHGECFLEVLGLCDQIGDEDLTDLRVLIANGLDESTEFLEFCDGVVNRLLHEMVLISEKEIAIKRFGEVLAELGEWLDGGMVDLRVQNVGRVRLLGLSAQWQRQKRISYKAEQSQRAACAHLRQYRSNRRRHRRHRSSTTPADPGPDIQCIPLLVNCHTYLMVHYHLTTVSRLGDINQYCHHTPHLEFRQ